MTEEGKIFVIIIVTLWILFCKVGVDYLQSSVEMTKMQIQEDVVLK